MGLFSIFKKRVPEIEAIPSGKSALADKIIEYVVSLIKDKESIKNDLKEINKARKLSLEEREIAYLPIYLRLENVITGKKALQSKEYYSHTTLRKQKEFTQSAIRKLIREKIGVKTLGVNFKVLFLDEPERNLILYELMLQKYYEFTPPKLQTGILEKITTLSRNNFLQFVKFRNGKFDFSSLDQKTDISSLSVEEVITAFRNLFVTINAKITEKINKGEADKVLKNVYAFAESYGYPLNSDALQALPTIQTKQATIAVARKIIDYLCDLTARKDLIQPHMDMIKDAQLLKIEEAVNVYFDIYLKLEKLLSEHLPPAVKKEYTRQELRKEIRQLINIQHLEHRFKLLFLDEKEQIVEFYFILYELFLKSIFSYWKLNDLQNFFKENAKDTLHEFINEFRINKDLIKINVSESRLSNLSKNKIEGLVYELGRFLNVFSKKTNTITDPKNVSKALSSSYTILKKKYGMLPAFADFVRSLPSGVLDFEKKILLSPNAAENVVNYMADLLIKEKIGEHLKSIENTKKLPLEGQAEAFFKIYLNLQNYIVETRPKINGKEISISDLKINIRKRVKVSDLEDKFQLLFLNPEEVLIKLVSDLINECAANFIDKTALVESERELFKKNQLLRTVTISEDGLIDFTTFLSKLENVKADRIKTLNSTLFKVTQAVHERAKTILGELQAKKLFEVSYSNLQEKYGANLLQVLKVVPKGLLESQKFELLGKEEVQKTAKELVKIDTMKGEFMNIAAHELKTPLVPIISYLEMLLDEKGLTPSQMEKLRICLSSAKREADLVSDILDITKLESGSMKFELETLEISPILKEAVMGLVPAVKQKNIYLKSEIPSKLPLVRADRRRLTQVLTNLINNSTKFTEKGGITVKAEAKPQEIIISVKDTGMGISKENLKKLFTKFFQVDSSARRAQGGTGLGLAICEGIVKGHRGKLWVFLI